jgi:hypothetical protein
MPAWNAGLSNHRPGKFRYWPFLIVLFSRAMTTIKANFYSGKLSLDWNGQESLSFSSGLELMTLTQRKIFLSIRDNFPEWNQAL